MISKIYFDIHENIFAHVLLKECRAWKTSFALVKIVVLLKP